MESLCITYFGKVKEINREKAEKIIGRKFTTRYGKEIPDSDVLCVSIEETGNIAQMTLKDGIAYQYRKDGKMCVCGSSINSYFTEWR